MLVGLNIFNFLTCVGVATKYCVNLQPYLVKNVEWFERGYIWLITAIFQPEKSIFNVRAYSKKSRQSPS